MRSETIHAPQHFTSDFERIGYPAPAEWLWQGFLRCGEITLLSGPFQSGKATLLCALLQRMAAGGCFLGMPLRAGRAWIFTPEPLFRWQYRLRSIPLGDHVGFIIHAGRGYPSLDDWQSLGHQAAEARQRGELDLLVIHALQRLYTLRGEPDPQPVLARLRPFCDAGGAVLILHGPLQRHSPAYGESLRANVDCVLTYSRHASLKWNDRLRLLTSQTRRSQTPARLACAWQPSTGQFELVEDLPAQRFEKQWKPIEQILKQSQAGMTFDELWNRWPTEHPRPSRATFYRLLNRASQKDRIAVEGRGTNNDPRRYWLAIPMNKP